MKPLDHWTIRDLFWAWLATSMIWAVAVAIQTWRDIPRDDWVSVSKPFASQLSDADAVLRPVTGIIDNPIARAIVVDGIRLAFVPPILALACGSALIWALREFPRPRK
jgi:hypothetical protein